MIAAIEISLCKQYVMLHTYSSANVHLQKHLLHEMNGNAASPMSTLAGI